MTVTHAAVDHIIISPGTQTIVAGTSQIYSATAFDAFGNSWNVTATYSIPSGADGSVADNLVVASAVGSCTVTGSFSGKTATATLIVTAGNPNHFNFSSVNAQTSGATFNITVTAQDAYGNTVTSYTGTPSLTVSDGSISPATMSSFVNGRGSASITLTAVGQNITISATDASTFGTTNAFTLNPTITASAGAKGAISPSGTVNINYSGNQTFTITPNTGYYIDTLTVDGSAVPVTSSYTFTDVEACSNITMTFALSTPTPQPTANPTATPTTSPTTAPTASPSLTKVSTVKVTDAPDQTIAPLITATGGSITQSVIGYSSNGDPIVNATAKPKQGYTFSHWIIDGVTVTNSSLTITMNQTHNLQAVFQVNSQATRTPMLATMGQYIAVIAAAIILGGIIIGVYIRRRK